MKLLVTGGAGFIGSNFVRNYYKGLYKDISRVTVLDNLSYSANFKNLDFISDNYKSIKFTEGDICDYSFTNEVLKDIDVVINFAAESHVDRSIISSKEFVYSNIVGVQNLLDSIIDQKHEIKFIQISTDEVYGDVKSGYATENYGFFPNSPYSATKASAELLIRSYVVTHKLNAIVTRGCNTFGPYQNIEKLIPKAITNILLNKKVPIYGTGENIREWIYVDEHCEAIYNLTKKGMVGEVYNVGSMELRSNLSILKTIISLMGVDDSFFEYITDRKGHDFRYAMNSQKYYNLFPSHTRSKLEENLIKTIEWYKNNPHHWQESLKHGYL